MNSENYIQVLSSSELFCSLSTESLEKIVTQHEFSIQSYGKEDVIFCEEEECQHLSFILDGKVEIQKIDMNGKMLSVAQFETGDVFGELLIFSRHNHFPMTVVAKQNSTIMHIRRDSVLKLCQMETPFLFAYLKMISDKAFILNKKLKEVTLKTIREQISEFILAEAQKQNSKLVKLPMTKKDWAEKIGVQRPSLSRELLKMQEEGILLLKKNAIEVLDMDALS